MVQSIFIILVPYHPSTNGAAKDEVESFKSALNKMPKEDKTKFENVPTLKLSIYFRIETSVKCHQN